MKPLLRSFAVALIALTVLSTAQTSAPAAEKFDFGLAFWPKDNTNGKEDLIPWQKVLFEMKNTLGGAMQLNYFVDACYAGIAKYRSDPALTGGIDLGIPYTMSLANTAASATRARKMYYDAYSIADPPPQGRPNADDNRRLKIGDYYYYSFDNYLTKKIKASDATLTVKQLYDAAKADVLADPVLSGKGQTPDFIARRGGDQNLPLKGGGADIKSRTLLFGRDTAGMHPETQFEEYQALNALNFDSMALYRHDRAQDLGHNPPIQGKGTWANFKIALGNLKDEMAVDSIDKFQTVINIFDVGHGTTGAKFDGRLGNRGAEEPGPGEGHILTGFDSTVGIPMDTDFWNMLKVGLIPPPPDADEADKDLIRIHQPRFFLAYSELSLYSSFSVSIGLSEGDPGISLGSFSPTLDSSGTFVLELSDSILSQLISTYDGATRLVLHFNFGVDDWIRVGVTEDMLYDPDYLSYTYGTGLEGVIAGTPEPATLALLLMGGLFARRRRRTTRHG